MICEGHVVDSGIDDDFFLLYNLELTAVSNFEKKH